MMLSNILKEKIAQGKATEAKEGDFQKAHHAAILAQKVKEGGVLFTFSDHTKMYFENLYRFDVEEGDVFNDVRK